MKCQQNIKGYADGRSLSEDKKMASLCEEEKPKT